MLGGIMKLSKIIITTIVLLACIAMLGKAQTGGETSAAVEKSNGSLPIGFGATFIDGETYYLINIAPELDFGQIGIGLDLNLRFNTNGKLRTGDYSKFGDYLRIIRYFRWAQKGEPIYARFGQLDYSLLGHGSIVYNYRNSASYDLRRTGIELDFNFDKFGFETMYSDFANRGLIGMRGYIKPLKFTKLANTHVISNIELGMTFARDFNERANITRWDSSGSGLSIIGFDIGIPLLYYKIVKSTFYIDYAKIFNYGHGTSIGVNMLFSGLAGVSMRGKYELRFNSVKYLPAYFNALYERERYDPVTKRSKSDSLIITPASNGYFGELVISILNTFNIVAGYQAPFNTKNQGVLHAELQLPEVSGLIIRGMYDKIKIGKVFILDEYTILSSEIGYKPVPFLMVSTLYQRTYSDRDAKGNQLDHYVAQDRVEPKISIIFEF
jgi:hypothetical protein